MGGDWVLEYSKGKIETRTVTSPETPQHWSGVLATFTVTNTNDSGAGSLREAITNANANAEADVINLPAGTYTLTSGELEITSEVTITGADAGSTIIDGNGDSRVFHLTNNTANLTLTDLTVQGGDTTDRGGGIFVHDVSAQLTATRVVVTGNIAGDGAGIYNSGTITLTDVEVSNNGYAGTFEGGGIYNRKEATLNGVTLSGNRSDLGGGIHNNQTSTGLSLTNVILSGNTAADAGGGLHNQADATIVNSTFSLNHANDGGGIANIEDTLSMTNVTVSGNTASFVGGGLFNQADATIVNCTFTLNDANNGGGISNSGGTVNIQNTIVAGNPGANPDVESLFTSLGFNLIGNKDGSNGFTDGVLGDQAGTTGSPINPLLGALQDNGGFTQTHACWPPARQLIRLGCPMRRTPISADFCAVTAAPISAPMSSVRMPPVRRIISTVRYRAGHLPATTAPCRGPTIGRRSVNQVVPAAAMSESMMSSLVMAAATPNYW